MTRSKIYNYTKDELQNMLNTYPTYTKILETIGIHTGSSTKILKRIIGEYNLDTSIFEKNHKEYMSKNSKLASDSKYILKDHLVNGKNSNSHKLKK